MAKAKAKKLKTSAKKTKPKAKVAPKTKTKTKTKAKAKAKAKTKTKAKAKTKTTAAPKTKAKAAPKPQAKPRAAKVRAPTQPPAPPTWHTWDDRPDELEVLDHVEAFAQALHVGDASRAFTLCPIYTYREPLLVGVDDTDAVARVWQDLQDTLVTWGYVGAGDAAWFTQLTPPSRVAYQQLNLALPEDQGDTLANVFVRDEVTDLTSIFSLVERAGRWQLAFKMFKVM